MSARKALIVGAGIGGLATALALRQSGWEVRLHERAGSPDELGFALSLAPNGLEALRELGIADAVTTRGVVTTSLAVRRADGTELRSFRRPSPASHATANVVVLRTALRGELLGALESRSLVFGSEALGFVDEGDGVTLRLANGDSESGDILIGADGIGSVIRKALHPNEPSPQPSGYCAVRGVARDAAARLGGLDAVSYLGAGVEAGMAAASEDAVYWYLSLLTRDVAMKDRHPADVAIAATASFDERLRAIIDATAPEAMRFDELLVRPPLARWGTGGVTLLGDAAHPLLPHTAQGAAQALEDAVALGLALRPAQCGITAALRRYERVRARRTRWLSRLGPRIAAVTTTHNRLIAAMRDSAIRLVPASLGVRALAVRRDPHRSLRPTS